MSESNDTTVENGNEKPRENRVFYTLVGVVMVFIIVVLINYISGLVSLRVDLTENKIYTLSDGTKRILDRIDTPITIRFYVTDDPGVMSPAERSYARRVDDFLREYQKAAKGMITIKKLNPEPDTDAEDSARLDGVGPGMSRETGNQMYLGLAVECVDQREVLPFLAARPETLLEYDLSRAIAQVHDSEKSKVVVMTSLKVAGGFSMGGMMGQRPDEPWFFYTDMLKDYDVETIPISSKQIPEGTSVLIVLHPYDITDVGQFAIDQYLLKGGKVMILVDPKLFAARFLSPPPNPQMPRPGGPAPSSNLDKLFAAWGIEFKSYDVLLDMKYQTQIRGGAYAPTILTLSGDAFNRDDVITSFLNDIFCIMPGAFLGNPKEGIKKDVLLHSSKLNQLVSTFSADPTQEGNVANLRENYKESGEERALIMRLSGTFPSAFPDGDPTVKKDEEKQAADDKDKKEGEDDDPAAKKDEEKQAADDKDKKEGEDDDPAAKKDKDKQAADDKDNRGCEAAADDKDKKKGEAADDDKDKKEGEAAADDKDKKEREAADDDKDKKEGEAAADDKDKKEGEPEPDPSLKTPPNQNEIPFEINRKVTTHT